MKGCDAKSVTAPKVERALLDYFPSVPDLDVTDKVDLEEKRQKVRQDTQTQIEALTDKLQRLDNKEREIMNFYINESIDFDSYRAMKKQMDADREFIRGELAKLSAAHAGGGGEPTITKADVVENFRENWEKLTDPEKRQFLMRFIKKIVLVNDPNRRGF